MDEGEESGGGPHKCDGSEAEMSLKRMRDSRRPTVGMSMVNAEDSEESSERDVGWD